MDHKTFQSYTTKMDAQNGIVEAIVAVMGNCDLGEDVIHPGAFTKTISERGGKVRVLDQHQTDSVLRAVGKSLAQKELSRSELPPELLARYPEATGGLWTKTQYLMNTPEGAGVFARIAAGAVDEYSIGYDPLDVDYSQRPSNGKNKTVRNLRTLKLYEYSPVLWGMNEATTTLTIKGATGAAGLPLADRARAWDAGAAEARVRTWADATDAPNTKYRQAFFWYDSDAPDNFTSYKLQFADVVDGTLTAIPRAVFAVAAALQGSRGGVDIPAGDKAAIQSKVEAYYAKMRKEFEDDTIVAPWAKAGSGPNDRKPYGVVHENGKWNVYKLDAEGNPTGNRLGSHEDEPSARAQQRALYANEGKSVSLTNTIQEIIEAFTEQFMGITCAVTEVFDDHVIAYEMSGMGAEYYSVDYTVTNGEVVFAPKPLWVEGTLVFQPESEPSGADMATMAAGNKAGRIFAGRNEQRLRKIKELIDEALAEIDKPDEGGHPSGDHPMNNEGDKPSKSATARSSMTPTVEELELEIEQLQLLKV